MADPAKDAARARFIEGIDLYRKHDFEAARVAFTQAYSVLKQRDVLFNLAAAERDSSHPLDALRHYRALLADPALDPKSKDDVVKAIADLEAKTSRIKIKATAGAKLTVDGVKVDEDTVDVLPGAHDVVATYQDGTTKKAQVSTKAGEAVDADVSSPTVAVPTATATATATAPPIVPPPTSQTPKLVAGGTMLGVGVLGLGAWGLFAALSNGAKGDSETLGAQHACANLTSVSCDEWRSTGDRQTMFHTVSIVSLIAGALLVVGGGAIVGWGVASKPTVVVAPTSGGLSLSMSGSF